MIKCIYILSPTVLYNTFFLKNYPILCFRIHLSLPPFIIWAGLHMICSWLCVRLISNTSMLLKKSSVMVMPHLYSSLFTHLSLWFSFSFGFNFHSFTHLVNIHGTFLHARQCARHWDITVNRAQFLTVSYNIM